MEGEPHFQFRQAKHPGRCPVKFCRRPSRADRAGRKPSAHRLCGRHSKAAWRLNHPTEHAFSNARHHARQRGIVWLITLDEFRLFVEGQGYVDGKGSFKLCLHLDRIDATKGYEVGNLQVLTCTANVTKGNQERRAGYVAAKVAAYEPDPF